jgi:vitamin B12 transporter
MNCSGLNIKIKRLKSIIVFFCLSCCLLIPVIAQQGEPMLPYLIEEVTISETNGRFFCEDKASFRVDRLAITYNGNQCLGDILAYQTPAMIRQYGPAGFLNSISVRGTGTNHTQVSWNGFAINSPTTGQADLSLIPAGFMQQVDVIDGASGTSFGSGTFGGMVYMANKPDWENRFGVEYTADGGSFGTISNRAMVQAGNHRWQYHASFLQQHAENDFRYTDVYKYGSPVLQRQHNAFDAAGIIQNFFLNLKDGSMLEAGCWYQQKVLEVPALMGNYTESNALQKDSTLRIFLTYRKQFGKSGLMVRTAWFTDDLHYTDKISSVDEAYSIDSKIGARQLRNEAEYRYYLSDRITLGAGADYNSLNGISSNYGNRVHEDEVALSAFMKLHLGKWTGNLGLRKEFLEGTDPGLLYSIGWRYMAAEQLVFRTNLSNKFRKPSFNEKYWKPGGNPNLRPEKGWGIDAGAEGRLYSGSGPSSIRYTAGGFFQCIDNWIQWVIKDSLTPVEYKTVHAKGIEAELVYQYKTKHLQFSSTLIYNLNRSVITRTYDDNALFDGKQLMYTPLHSGKISQYVLWKGWITSLNLHASGKRESVDSNDESLQLPGYIIADAMTGYEKKFKSVSLMIGFRIENLLNARYEIIRAYPMPGRACYITFSVGFDKHQTNY